jgi:hypothetical protein
MNDGYTYFVISRNIIAASAPPVNGPTTGIQQYFQSLLPFLPMGKMACIIRGPKSLAGLIA